MRPHPSLLRPRRTILATLRPVQVVGKQNSSIQFLPGQPHFQAHSSSFILRDWVHLSLLIQLCEDVSCLLHGNWK